MEKAFEEITSSWLNKAFVLNGSIGRMGHDFRYRLAQDDKEKKIHAAAYSRICYEKAEDKVERDFDWDESGIEALKLWLQERYEAFLPTEPTDNQR